MSPCARVIGVFLLTFSTLRRLVFARRIVKPKKVSREIEESTYKIIIIVFEFLHRWEKNNDERIYRAKSRL